MIFRVSPHRDSKETLSGFVVPDKELVWRLTPRSSGPLATNSLGLRDSAYNPSADLKILLLGDSISWGDGIVDLKRVYPQILEGSFNKTVPSKRLEIINSGVPGYSTFQQLRYLEKYGLALKPNAILVQFCLNDVVERFTSVAEFGGYGYSIFCICTESVYIGTDRCWGECKTLAWFNGPFYGFC